MVVENKHHSYRRQDNQYGTKQILPETSMIQGMSSSRRLCMVTPSFNMTMKTSAFIRVAYRSPDHMNSKQLRK